MLLSFSALYYGNIALDRRHTPAMLPWVVADIRRTGKLGGTRCVRLIVGTATLKALEEVSSGEVVLFEHQLHTLMRFSRAQHEPRCFSYLTRANSELPFACHVFSAAEESLVSILLLVCLASSLLSMAQHLLGVMTLVPHDKMPQNKFRCDKIPYGQMESLFMFFSKSTTWIAYLDPNLIILYISILNM